MKRNKKAFNKLWENVAVPQFELLKRQFNFICVPPHAKEDVWEAYKIFNLHCSENYMEDSSGLLDRHKVSACLILAIISVSPISVPRERVEAADDLRTKRLLATINERFAITVGASDLVAYIVERHIASVQDGSNDSSQGCLKISGVPFDCFAVNHGEDYLENLAVTLNYTKCEKNYNILLLANTIYHWDLKTCEVAGISFE